MQKIDILLVRPINKNIQNIIPNLGLGYLSKTVKSRGYTVKILDCIKEKFNYRNFLEFIVQNEFRCIGFQAFTFDIPSIKKSIDICREIRPEAILIIGGPHPSGDPYNIFKFIENLDFGFKGEAEESFPLFLDMIIKNRKIDYSEIPGLIWKKDNKTIVNKMKLPSDLDSIGMPDWEEINPRSYPLQPHGIFLKKPPVAPIIASRGCPYLCTFCAGREVSGSRIRYRSIENIMNDISYLNREFGINEIHIEDDNFTLNKNYVLKFCNQLKKTKMNIVWSLPNGVRLDSLDSEVLMEMKNSGCYSFAIGIESGSQHILDLTKKKLTIKKIIDKVNLIHDCGIKTTGFFMLGLPDETIEDYRSTLSLALSLPLDRADFSIFIPLPGTKEYNIFIQDKAFNLEMFNDFTALKILYNFSKIKKENIEKLQQKSFFKFYFRLKIIISIISELKNKEHFLFFLKRIRKIILNY